MSRSNLLQTYNFNNTTIGQFDSFFVSFHILNLRVFLLQYGGLCIRLALSSGSPKYKFDKGWCILEGLWLASMGFVVPGYLWVEWYAMLCILETFGQTGTEEIAYTCGGVARSFSYSFIFVVNNKN